ncbi:MAG: MipA/OmpV family protein [Planctomycetes bacterium]|nr:MipA/OmpV family protein [Planctomycetota bacterium]MBL7145014.1 MipA/OmpV family protein [Phycisphaerae bacterium]
MSIFHVIMLAVVVETGFGPNVKDSGYAGPKNLFLVGGGAIITKNPYKGIDTEIHGIPIIIYKTERFSLYGPRMSYLLFEDDGWEISSLAKVRFEGYEESDSRYLRGMDDREWTLELGGSLSKTFMLGKLTADFGTDILNEHKGHELRLSYSYDFRDMLKIPALTLTPNIGVNYRSRQLNDYYYGVRASEVIAGRPEYYVGDSTGLMAGVRLNYTLSENLSLMGMISFEWLGDEIKNSPIVDEDHIESFLLGIMYRF